MPGLWPRHIHNRRPAPASTPGPHAGRCPFPALLRLTIWLVCGLGMIPAAGRLAAQEVPGADNPRLSLPRSRLDRPQSAPVYLAAQAGIGGAFSGANDQFGYGGQIIFHPSAASSFLDVLYDWNTALVLQGDYQEMFHSYRIRSGDLLLRRYLRPAGNGGEGAALLPFFGLGIGISEISFPLAGSTATDTNWAPLAEAGWEAHLQGGPLLLCRAQYRHFDRGGNDYSNWSVRAGVGLPLP